MQSIETLIVGGGQAGLATSSFLQQAGREHLVLEQADTAADVWQSGRWDSFHLVIPNWTFRLPGAEYDGPNPDGFMPRGEIVDRFSRYVEQFQLPVRTQTRVNSIEADGTSGYRVSTSNGDYRALNVVIATGMEQLPRIPKDAEAIANDVTQIHSSAYRNPDALPPGAVLVVGSAQSGAQIAEELYQSGRQVYHSVGFAGRAPRRYRGRDIFDWLFNHLHFFDLPPEQFPAPIDRFAPPHVTGAMGGHTLNLHQFASDGVRLFGHVGGADGHQVRFEPDLHECLGRADGFEKNVQEMIDTYVAASGMNAPADELPQLSDGFAQPVVDQIDLRAEGISAIVWATGYRFDYGLVKLPVVDPKGRPVSANGVTEFPGLYFVGMPWMPSLRTGILPGMGEHARSIAEHIIARSGSRRPARAA
ncbi:MAG TPA: NAD(P)-binding domain-containing protein [Thermomicrobiales bacterium]|nr:NAD(P)-binding domain-containing protein [Thermomicrobiales bacterium]